MTRITTEQKQSELERYRVILLATLDYFLERHGGMIIYDQMDPITAYYEELKVQTVQYYQQRKLDRLKYRLGKLIQVLQNETDLKFSNYIKQKTGHDIDIFENLKESVNIIIGHSAINNQKEQHEVLKLLNYYEQTTTNKEKKDQLNTLLINYAKQQIEVSTKTTNNHTHLISRIEKDDVVQMKFLSYTGPKLKHYEENEMVSPDGKRKLTVIRQNAGKYSSTRVSITFPKANGEIYSVNQICSDIKAFWKDNQIIVITTRKDYVANVQYKQMQSFGDVIAIEYIVV